MKNKYIVAIILLLIISLGIFLRFYKFYPNVIFNGEMGTDYLRVWQMLHGGRTWLIGPSTSHEWFSISPLAYWIYGVVLSIGRWNPISINIFWGIISVLAIPITFYYVKKLFNQKIALISSFLLAVSPAWIIQARDARYNLVVSILFLPYLYYLKKSIEDKGKSLLKLGLILGIMMSFFPSPILLIPAVVASFLFFKVKPRFKYVLNLALGFLLPNITFFIYEIGNKFEITIKLLSWVPYRILGFFGLYQKNTVSSEIVGQNIFSVYKYFGNIFGINNNIISIIILVLVMAGILIFIKKNIAKKRENASLFILIISLIIFYLGLFVHGNPPSHYYYTIYIIPLILISYFVDKIIKNKVLMATFVLAVGGACLCSLTAEKWFFQDTLAIDYQTRAVSYSTQDKITDSIIEDSGVRPFYLRRIGPNDQFENNFANNYIYLLLIRGRAVNNNSITGYTIVEGKDNIKNLNGKIIFSENDVFVFKNEI